MSEFVADSTPKGLRVRVSYEPTLLGSAGTLAANRDFCSDGPFFIIYGDNLSDVDLGDLYASHMQQRPVLTLGTFEAECPERCGIAEIDPEGGSSGALLRSQKDRCRIMRRRVSMWLNLIFSIISPSILIPRFWILALM